MIFWLVVVCLVLAGYFCIFSNKSEDEKEKNAGIFVVPMGIFLIFMFIHLIAGL